MPRPKRIHSRNSIYHVLSRGNRKKNIFLEESDKGTFCKYLKLGLERYDHQVLAFCLMDNHFHLAIKVHNTPLESVIHQLLSRYAKYFNAKYNLVGHCFQGRYVSKCVFDDSYLFDLCKYIHLNPVRAGLVKAVDDFYWCSHCCYLNSTRFTWVNTSILLERIDSKKNLAIKKYIRFIHDRTEYPKEILFELNTAIKDTPKLFLHKKTNANKLIKLVAEAYNETPLKLASDSRSTKNTEIRAVIAHLAIKHKICTLTTLASAFHRSQPAVSRALKRLETRLKNEPCLLKRIKKIEKTIN